MAKSIIIKPRRTYTTDKLPTDMVEGELIQNIADKKLISLDNNNNTIEYPSIDLLRNLISEKKLLTTEDVVSYFNNNQFQIDPETGVITYVGNDSSGGSNDTEGHYKFKLSRNYEQNLINLAPGTFNISYDGCNYCIKDGGDDIYNWGNYIYSDGRYLEYTFAKFRGYGFLLYNLDDVDSLRFWGNISVTDYSASNVDTVTNLQPIVDVDIYVSYKVVHTCVSHAVHHVVFTKKPIKIHYWSTSPNSDYDDYRFDEGTDIVLLVMWTKSSEAWNNNTINIQKLLDALFLQN